MAQGAADHSVDILPGPGCDQGLNRALAPVGYREEDDFSPGQDGLNPFGDSPGGSQGVQAFFKGIRSDDYLNWGASLQPKRSVDR